MGTYPSPGRLSGHQLYENGRGGYAEEEDHESKIASGRFGSDLLTATYKNKPAKQMANM
jgi:hypothetical protein